LSLVSSSRSADDTDVGMSTLIVTKWSPASSFVSDHTTDTYAPRKKLET